MPSVNPKIRPMLVVLGVLLVGATALPLVSVWRAASAPPGAASPAAEFTGDLIVDLRDDATDADVRAIEARFGMDLEDNSIEARNDRVLRADLNDIGAARRIAAALKSDSRVEAVEPEVRYAIPEPTSLSIVADPPALTPPPSSPGGAGSPGRFVPNDPRYKEQWNLKMVGAESAWERTRGKGVVVAVIDTGVASGQGTRGQQARDFNKTRFARGYDFVHDDDDPYDDHGHGTHVAGTIAESTNNREGVAGLAFEATVMPLKVLTSEGWGTTADIADAIRFAADHGANVINMSLGSPSPSDVIHNAVKYARKKGVVIVCAAGNGFGEPVGFPAAFPECIAVSSVGPSGEIAFYSSYGKQVALAAPGGDMTKGPADGILQNTIWAEEQGGRGDDYYPFQGTSMAAPHVAATAALVMAQGERDPARVRDLLVGSASPRQPSLKYGAGILSAAQATAKAAGNQGEAAVKRLLFAFLVGLFLLRARRIPPRFRLLVALAFCAGFFGPDWLAAKLGADSPWNLVTFGALIPFLLFWELEAGWGSRLVAALALGVALCLLGDLVTGMQPFTATAFGDRALPWTLSNAAVATLIALAGWRRGNG